MTTHTGPLYPVAAEVLAALTMHRILDTGQVHRLVMPHAGMKWTRKVLGDLRGLHLADTMRQRQSGGPHRNLPAVWWATKAGVEAARTMPAVRQARVVQMDADKVAAGTQLHTLAVNETCIQFTEAARHRGDNATWLNEVSHRVTNAIGPDQYATADALLTLDLTPNGRRTTTMRILLELDRGTKPYDRIIDQMRKYLAYRKLTNGENGDKTPAWHAKYPPIPSAPVGGFPLILWVFDCPNAERRMQGFRDLMTDRNYAPDLVAARNELWVLLTTRERLQEHGPYGAVFLEPYNGVLVDLTGRPKGGTPIPAQRVTTA